MASNVASKIALGAVCCCGYALTALLIFYAAAPWIDAKEIPVFRSRFVDSLLFGVAALICAFVTARLFQGTWWTALTASVAILGLGVWILFAALHPRNEFAASESGFGIALSTILITTSFVTSVLLAFLRARGRFAPS